MPPPMHIVTTASLAASAPELVEGRGRELGAGASEWMAEGDGAAVDVELVVGDAELLLDVDRLAAEGLVDLEDVDVVDREVVLGEQLLDRRERADAHDRRVDADRDE